MRLIENDILSGAECFGEIRLATARRVVGVFVVHCCFKFSLILVHPKNNGELVMVVNN